MAPGSPPEGGREPTEAVAPMGPGHAWLLRLPGGALSLTHQFPLWTFTSLALSTAVSGLIAVINPSPTALTGALLPDRTLSDTVMGSGGASRGAEP